MGALQALAAKVIKTEVPSSSDVQPSVMRQLVWACAIASMEMTAASRTRRRRRVQLTFLASERVATHLDPVDERCRRTVYKQSVPVRTDYN